MQREDISYGSDTQNEYGEDTAGAVVQFQAKYGIKQTGYVGPLTRAKINSIYGCGENSQADIAPPQESTQNDTQVSPSQVPIAQQAEQSVVSNRCSGSSDCQTGYYCENTFCVRVPGTCLSDSECKWGKCVSGSCGGCSVHSDCNSKELACFLGKCLIRGCSKDSQCDEGRICFNLRCIPSTGYTNPTENGDPSQPKIKTVCELYPLKFGSNAVCFRDSTFGWDLAGETKCSDYCAKIGKTVDKKTRASEDDVTTAQTEFRPAMYTNNPIVDTSCGRANYSDTCCSCQTLDPGRCDSIIPCPSGKVCQNGFCIDKPAYPNCNPSLLDSACPSGEKCVNERCSRESCMPQGNTFYPPTSSTPSVGHYGCCPGTVYIPNNPSNIEAGGKCLLPVSGSGNCILEGRIEKYTNYGGSVPNQTFNPYCCGHYTYYPDNLNDPKAGGRCGVPQCKKINETIGFNDNVSKCCEGLKKENSSTGYQCVQMPELCGALNHTIPNTSIYGEIKNCCAGLEPKLTTIGGSQVYACVKKELPCVELNKAITDSTQSCCQGLYKYAVRDSIGITLNYICKTIPIGVDPNPPCAEENQTISNWEVTKSCCADLKKIPKYQAGSTTTISYYICQKSSLPSCKSEGQTILNSDLTSACCAGLIKIPQYYRSGDMIGISYYICKSKTADTCVPNWTCSTWGACINGSQSRTCSDVSCGNLAGGPAIRQTCTATCTPSCSEKTCGSDGCGGVCGTCSTNQICDASQNCVARPLVNVALGKLRPANSLIASIPEVYFMQNRGAFVQAEYLPSVNITDGIYSTWGTPVPLDYSFHNQIDTWPWYYSAESFIDLGQNYKIHKLKVACNGSQVNLPWGEPFPAGFVELFTSVQNQVVAAPFNCQNETPVEIIPSITDADVRLIRVTVVSGQSTPILREVEAWGYASQP
jgi:hypothetical protein